MIAGFFRFCKEEVVHDNLMPLVFGPEENQANDNSRGLPVLPMIQLLIALRFYATGSYQTVVGDIVGISQCSLCRIIKKISIIFAMKIPLYVKLPNQATV